MALSENPSGTIESMHAEVQANGTPDQRSLAAELLRGHNNVGLGLDLSLKLHRDAMEKLLREVRGAK